MVTLTPALLKASLAKLNYHWHDPEPNIIGIRRSTPVPDKFNDLMVCCWRQPAMPKGLSVLEQQKFLKQWLYVGKDGKLITADGIPGGNTNHALQHLDETVGKERLKSWIVTTVPGIFHLQAPQNPKGCAVLVPDQYKDVYQLGLHKGRKDHPALVQTGGHVKAFRDSDRDKLAEETSVIDIGNFGINIHRSNPNGASARVYDWSAGCQVFQRLSDHTELLGICEGFRHTCSNKFSYTLLRERELAVA